MFICADMHTIGMHMHVCVHTCICVCMCPCACIEACEIFNNYFICVASNIDFDDTIPTDFDTDDGLSAKINKYCRHSSIVKIKENSLDKALFDFESITSRDVEKIINGFNSKKAHGYDKMPMKLLQKCANTLRQILLNWLILPSVNASFLTTQILQKDLLYLKEMML